MTILYFSSNILVTYGVFYIVYKSSRLGNGGNDGGKSGSGGHLIVYGILANLFTQILKMLIIVTFLPSFDSSSVSLYQEFIKCVGNIVDLYSMSLILKFVQGGRKDVKTFGLSLGWAFSTAILSQIVPLSNTLTLQFDWSYLLDSIQSNFITLQQLIVFKLVNQFIINYNNNNNNNYQQHHHHSHNNDTPSPLIINLLLLSYIFMQSVFEWITHLYSISHLFLVIVEFVNTALFFIISKYKILK